MGRWWLYVKESVNLLRRNRTAWFISQCMMIVAVGVTGLLAEIVLHVDAIEAKVAQGFSLELFLDVTADSSAINRIAAQLPTIRNVTDVDFVSREQAARRFSESIGIALPGTPEENPLPASFQVTLDPTCSAYTVDSIAAALASWRGTDEVVYPRELFHLVEAVQRKVNSTGLAIAIAISCAAFVLTTVLLRLSIHSERDKIQVMSLLGASRAMIRIPFLLAGVILGGVGGAIAALAVALLSSLAQYFFQIAADQGWISCALMVVGGMLWGYLASIVAVIWGTRSV